MPRRPLASATRSARRAAGRRCPRSSGRIPNRCGAPRSSLMAGTWRAGVDIGGTFTDIVLLAADGRLQTRKISSSVGNYAQAIVDGLADLFAGSGLAGADIEE